MTGTPDRLTEEKNFYDDLYRRKGQGSMRPQWVYDRWFQFLKPVRAGESLLDVGCGTGLFLHAAAASGLVTTGLELSDAAIALAHQNSPQSIIVQGTAEALPFATSSFEYVVCLGTLEHVPDLKQALAELVRVAKPDARFLIVVPNDNYFFWKLKKIKKGTAQRNFEELKTLDSWKTFFEAGGLEIVGPIRQDRYPSQELRIFGSLNPYRIIRRSVYKLVWLLMPLPLTYQFIFVFKKKQR